MAANVRTEMRIPTRAAPRPPVNTVNSGPNPVWGSTNDIFRNPMMLPPVQKRKPPPRPPPPKFNQNHLQNYQKDQKQKKPPRPTNLLTNFFGRKDMKVEPPPVNRSNMQSHASNNMSQSNNLNGTVSLIDLSPPGSPTFTTRSSSDGVSIDSFGSDGNSNPSVFTSSGNTSQTESFFEDDFDFFGLSNKQVTQNDPWQVKGAQDPFGPIEINKTNTSQNVKQIGDSSFFAFNSSANNQVPFGQSNLKPALSMPTIIRARPPKPPAPKILQKKMESVSQKSYEKPKNLFDANPMLDTLPLNKPVSLDIACSWDDDPKDDSPSPPMPTIPPPAPPPEYLLDSNVMAEKPYGIALYDYSTTHPDDLPFKKGDVITLVTVINEDWIKGQIGNRQGMFPANFIDIKVPLPGLENVVTALYTFKAETAEDLSFEEGAKITVLSRISEDWLYGECEGRRGQFPANYVNRIPPNIPKPF